MILRKNQTERGSPTSRKRVHPVFCTETVFKRIFFFRCKKIRTNPEKSILAPFPCKKFSQVFDVYHP